MPSILGGAVFEDQSLDNDDVGHEVGVLVIDIEPGSAAQTIGLQSGDVVVAVDNIEIDNLQILKNLLQSSDLPITLHVMRGHEHLHFVLG